MMKKIALIYMGGTFGCIGEPLSPMPADTFIPQLKRILPMHLEIECFVAPVIRDSSACTAVEWLQLVQQIQDLQLQQFQHFVILHGTDTLSYASAILARFLAQSAHIVLTGSQYPLLNIQGTDTREFTDAIDNLNFALDAAVQHPAGVYLAFHHQLIHASSALKVHTTELNAFSGVPAEQIKSELSPLIVHEMHLAQAGKFNCLSLMLLPASLNILQQNLAAIASQAPHALILQGYGTGNIAVNDEIILLLQQLQQQGCAVILTTQVPFGKIDQRYAVSQWIEQANILLSNCDGHADLYAKALKMHLQYGSAEQWHRHWCDE